MKRREFVRALGGGLLATPLVAEAQIAPGASPGRPNVAFPTIPAGAWHEVPNSRLDAVAPKPPPDGIVGVPAVTAAWGSGCYDPTRQRLYVMGGGHTDYSGNEIYQFDIPTLAWSRLTEPTPWHQVPHFARYTGPAVDTYADGRPASIHVYGMMQFLPPPVDRIMFDGGSRWYDGNGSAKGWYVNPANGAMSSFASAGQGLGHSSGHDVARNRVIGRGPVHYFEFDPAKSAWAPISKPDNTGTYDGHSTAVDWIKRRVLTIGLKNGPGTPCCLLLDLTRLPTAAVDLTGQMAGATEILSRYGPGLIFDPLRGVFAAYAGGAALYSIDVDAKTITKIIGTGAPLPTTQEPNGTFGRFRYLPLQDVYIFYNHTNENVFLYRPATVRTK